MIMPFIASKIKRRKIIIMSSEGKIRGFHGGDYEEGRLLGYYAVWLL
jgi:hypothetical protein